MSNKRLVLKEVSEERDRQDRKWGEQKHAPDRWCLILGEEVGEVNKAVLEYRFSGTGLKDYRDELIQVAAICVAAIECLDKQNSIG